MLERPENRDTITVHLPSLYNGFPNHLFPSKGEKGLELVEVNSCIQRLSINVLFELVQRHFKSIEINYSLESLLRIPLL